MLCRVLRRPTGYLYPLLMMRGTAIVTWKGGTASRQAVFALLVVAVLLAPIAPTMYRSYQYRQKYLRAEAIFEERCKSAGQRIYRTAEGIEGVQLTSIRDSDVQANRANPMWEDAALPNEHSGDGYIRSFLYFENHDDKRSTRGYLTTNRTDLAGYHFVDAMSREGTVIRYRLTAEDNSGLSASEVPASKAARYAVSFANMVDAGDRAYWIAGTTVRVLDTKTDEVMAEHTWYSWEPGLGSTAGYRAPWGFAQTCPKWKGWDGGRTRMFVDQVLRPKQVESR